MKVCTHLQVYDIRITLGFSERTQPVAGPEVCRGSHWLRQWTSALRGVAVEVMVVMVAAVLGSITTSHPTFA